MAERLPEPIDILSRNMIHSGNDDHLDAGQFPLQIPDDGGPNLLTQPHFLRFALLDHLLRETRLGDHSCRPSKAFNWIPGPMVLDRQMLWT